MSLTGFSNFAAYLTARLRRDWASATEEDGEAGLPPDGQPTSISNATSKREGAPCKDDLFVRTPQGLSPTAVAREMYPAIKQALDALRATLAEASGFDPVTSQRRFRISIPHPMGPSEFLHNHGTFGPTEVPGLVAVTQLDRDRLEHTNAGHFYHGTEPSAPLPSRTMLIRVRSVWIKQEARLGGVVRQLQREYPRLAL